MKSILLRLSIVSATLLIVLIVPACQHTAEGIEQDYRAIERDMDRSMR